jgi:predicted AAA+ superfamily ATPase
LHQHQLIILDEVQRLPNLFAPLRSIIDQRRRNGQKYRQFLLLGSASISLLQQSSESLAGRIAYAEMVPLSVQETQKNISLEQLYLRGGFPESLQSQSDRNSLQWRENFVRTYLERDIPQLGPRIPAETLRRFWTMLAHTQSELFNASSLARGLDLSSITISRYLDLLVDLLLVRRLQPWHSNLGKRMVKAPKIYIRDSGICHALLGIETLDELLSHPVIGGSWEGFIIEQILNQLPAHTRAGFYRTSTGAEIDLIIETNKTQRWAIEIKRSSAPSVSKGFHTACQDIAPTHKIVVHSGESSFPLGEGIQAMPLSHLLQLF